jgi:hypothetical protein
MAVPGIGEAPGAPGTPPAGIYTPDQVKRDPACWGKTITVRGKATQAVRELDGYWMVILEGNLRCRLRKGLAVNSGIVGRVIGVQGTVVPRPDKVITSGAHMVNCIILPF